ncbi:MAG: LysM peptidoglycan-binding domain-containing protein [Planctomycetia bacterium]|nr:LysM peptidoglycan-binding domain-containing protein [Planctomycetia bacterium]
MEFVRTIFVALLFACITVGLFVGLDTLGWLRQTPTGASNTTAEDTPAPAGAVTEANQNSAPSNTVEMPGNSSAVAQSEGLPTFELPGLDDNLPPNSPSSAFDETEAPPVLSTAPIPSNSSGSPQVASNAGLDDSSALPGLDLPGLELPAEIAPPTAAPPAPSPFDAAPIEHQVSTDSQVGTLPTLSTAPLPSPDESLPGLPTLPSSSGIEETTALPSASGISNQGVTNPLRAGESLPALPVASAPSAGLEASVPAQNDSVYSVASASVPNSNATPPLRSSAEADTVREYLLAAEQKIKEGKALEVLKSLSPFYGDSRFTSAEMERLTELLVKSATEVIYLPKSYMEPPYIVEQGDTLESIAAQYNIPTEFLARVNGLAAGQPLTPGASLKVVRGPFNAVIYLDRYEMLLTLNGMFAGRFWIGIGGDLQRKDGDFSFRQKLAPKNMPVTSQNIAFEFVRNLNQTDMKPGSFLHLQPDTHGMGVGRESPHGYIILNPLDIDSLGALLGNRSLLFLRCSSNLGTASAQPPAQVATSAPVATPVGSGVSVPTGAPATSNDLMSTTGLPPVGESMGSQASLPGYDPGPTLPNPGVPAPSVTVPSMPSSSAPLGLPQGLPDSLPQGLPAELPPDASFGGSSSALPSELPSSF